MKVIVLGLDGATFDLIDPWVEAGELPNIKSVMESGAHGTLTSALPAHSAPSWSSFITGKNPGKHGIFDFSEHVEGSYEVKFINASRRQGASVWSTVSKHGKKVAVLNVPMTYPPEKVNGIFVCGMDAPGIDSNATYPPSFYDEIKQAVGDYNVEAGVWTYIEKGQIGLAIEKQHETIDKRFEVMKYLMGKDSWDLFITVFTATDRVQHAFWKFMDPKHPQYKSEMAEKYGDAILGVYRKMDKIVGYILENMDDETTLIMMSDHGAGLCSNKTLYLNNWLCSKGFLEYKDFKSEQPSGIAQKIKRKLYTEWLGGIPRDYWKALPRTTRDKIKKRIPFVFNKMASQFFFSRINMEATKAYSEESKNFIWINLKGREPKGTVNPGHEYEDVKQKIVDALIKERDSETGELVVESVIKREEIYHGENFDYAPDLVVMFKDGGYIPRPSYTVPPEVVLKIIPPEELEETETATRANARHLPNGILLMRGPNVKKACKVEGANIMDLAPTILYLLGLPVPIDMDGKVVESAIAEAYLAKNKIEQCEPDASDGTTEVGGGYSNEEEEAIKKRLEDLGYL